MLWGTILPIVYSECAGMLRRARCAAPSGCPSASGSGPSRQDEDHRFASRCHQHLFRTAYALLCTRARVTQTPYSKSSPVRPEKKRVGSAMACSGNAAFDFVRAAP